MCFLRQILQLEPILTRILPFWARSSTSPSPCVPSMEKPCTPTFLGWMPSVFHSYHNAHNHHLIPDPTQNKQLGDEHKDTPSANYTTRPTTTRGNHKWLLGLDTPLISTVGCMHDLKGGVCPLVGYLAYCSLFA